ncbi:MAG TPA: DEAD/DEAH box helicase [Thermoanaerobaculia bacterium]|nr:DEAD/DEAH box helicase [Thermoanaerobaculia bacterium]
MSFTSYDLDPSLLLGVADLGFTEPTPIQRDGIPPALEGRDVLACAMTGSGKTAAFALPILQRLLGKKRGTTRALVLAPTRELAAQIVEHFNDLAKHTQIRAAAVYGGVGMGPQEKAFRTGIDVIVACPGRLLDHFQYSYARLAGLEVLVLDEADRMLDMGFLPDIRRVLKHLPPVAQTLFFSATVPPPIRELSRQMLKNPVMLNIERASAPATGVEQAIYPVRQDVKSALLLELLKGNAIENAIVFTRTKHRANRLHQYLERHGISADRVHGNRSQPQRTQALADFKSGRIRVLVATDIAARGIDVEGLSHVVNFDVPNVPDDYIHRVGRTARAGATGMAFTFVSPDEMNELRAIERAVAKVLPRKTLDGFDYQPKTAEKLEIPLAERLAAMRSQRSGERARANANANARNDRKPQPQPAGRSATPPATAARPSAPRPAAARTLESRRRGAGDTMNPWPGRSAAPGPQRRRLR